MHHNVLLYFFTCIDLNGISSLEILERLELDKEEIDKLGIEEIDKQGNMLGKK